MSQAALVWFRNDLRLHDNESIHAALSSHKKVIFLYSCDPRFFTSKTSLFGFDKIGTYRKKFLLQSIVDLKVQIEKLGGELLVTLLEPEVAIEELLQQCTISALYYQAEVTAEELFIEQKVKLIADKNNISIRKNWGMTLIHPFDLPFSISQLPDVFTSFRKQVEKRLTVRECFVSPETLPSSLEVTVSQQLTHEHLQALISELDNTLAGLNDSTLYSKSAISFTGGEYHAIHRLQDYFWKNNLLPSYKETRNGLIGMDYSSKFSAWLANGSLSARFVYSEVKRYEQEVIANESTYWLIFELLWRDYFRFVAMKYSNAIFKKNGLQSLHTIDNAKRVVFDKEKFEIWRLGQTGDDFVDANMRELLHTGFMSNRGRQNVASYLVHYLKLDWRAGAEWFESTLVDYDVCSNYGNWNYLAGVGNDPRENRVFNTQRQAQMYDGDGKYRKMWLSK